ncbi:MULTISPECIES: helix-turn-helix domain-containing protein [unclassified Pseudomonas]|uniref:winged helix-turn-helix transcriptional regulator n=1 Tax=Pseudomonas sp. GV071 TaxID=2135754 RepID=UPI000D3A69E9|nr:HxlR family transcriptional regulator [Pseudomonas sp. GV071]
MPNTPVEPVEHCPVARSVDLIGDRWSLLIVRDAFDGTHRFSDFQRSLGVARNILADRLRQLVQADILTTRPVAAGSAYQEYVLTARGERLFPLLVALRQWGEGQLFAEGEMHSQLVDTRTGQTLAPLTPTTRDGAPVLAADTQVIKVEA